MHISTKLLTKQRQYKNYKGTINSALENMQLPIKKETLQCNVSLTLRTVLQCYANLTLHTVQTKLTAT